MARLLISTALFGAALLVLAAAPASADGSCSQVPNVGGVDQSPTNPGNWGKCTGAIESQFTAWSHWCKAGDIGLWPNGPTDQAKKCMKFGRSTIYRGPIYGSSYGHMAACNKRLHGDDDAALVAVSTKYLKSWQGGWTTDKGACDKCMCIHIHGGDNNFNKGLQTDKLQQFVGLTFKGKVGDRCGECEDDHIDLLQDRPLSWAPFNPSGGDNFYAPYVNAKDGLRGVRDPNSMRTSTLEGFGVLSVDWQWVPCSYTHEQCATMMKGMGYGNSFTPGWTEGVDSFSMRPISQLRGASNDRLFKEPYTK